MLTEINENSNVNPITWAKISNGLIVVNSDASDPKAKTRVNKLGNQVYERFYASIGGIITGLSVEENKFGETEVRVTLMNEEKKGVLSFNLDSAYGRGFLAQIFNVDLTKNVAFHPWQKVFEDGSKRTNLYLNYSKNEKVHYKLPEGTPEVKWVETKKGKVVDPVSKAEHDDFLDVKLKEFIANNNLTSNRPQMTGDEFVQAVGELTDEEKKQLKKPTAEKVKGSADITESSMDDFFKDM
jgi:hypothetical protein